MHSLTVHFPPTRQDSTVCILGPLDLQIKHNVCSSHLRYLGQIVTNLRFVFNHSSVALTLWGGAKSHKVPILT